MCATRSARLVPTGTPARATAPPATPSAQSAAPCQSARLAPPLAPPSRSFREAAAWRRQLVRLAHSPMRPRTLAAHATFPAQPAPSLPITVPPATPRCTTWPMCATRSARLVPTGTPARATAPPATPSAQSAAPCQSARLAPPLAPPSRSFREAAAWRRQLVRLAHSPMRPRTLVQLATLHA